MVHGMRSVSITEANFFPKNRWHLDHAVLVRHNADRVGLTLVYLRICTSSLGGRHVLQIRQENLGTHYLINRQ